MTKNRIVSLVLIAIISVGVLFVGGNMMGSNASIAEGLVDGTYEGVSDAGMHAGLKVHVEVKDGMIVDIKVVSHGETPGISDPALSGVPASIVVAQSTEVDVVSGATLTSNAIIEAVKIALESEPGVSAPVVEYEDGIYEGVSDKGMNAGLKVQVEVIGGKIASVTVIEHDETPGISDPALTGVPEAIVTANSYEVDVVSGATFTSDAIIEAVKLALEAGPVSLDDDKIPSDLVYVDGVYEGVSDEGMYPGLKVQVEVIDGKIASVTVIEHEETPGISDPAIIGVPAAIVEAHTPSVDVVSGATFTSKAIIEAVTLALKDAVSTGEPVVEDVVYADGVYEGVSDEGMYPGLTVQVEVVDGKIASVSVVAHEETPGISDPAITGVPEAIVAANSYDVDVVSGATFTSKAIIEATMLALENAVVTEEVSYKDGVYEGISDEGMYPGLTVQVEVVDGKIANVSVIAHEETPGISDPAITGVPEAIVAANSYDVDVVSGATFTSKAIIEATMLALENAK